MPNLRFSSCALRTPRFPKRVSSAEKSRVRVVLFLLIFETGNQLSAALPIQFPVWMPVDPLKDQQKDVIGQ